MTIDNKIWDTLDKFFATKTIQDIDRNTFLNCVLKDNINKVTITLIFTKNYNISEADSYNFVSISPEGAVFTFPCYWISVPKELAIPYFKFIISKFYDEEISKWTNSNNSNNGPSCSNTGGANNNCNCCTPCGINI